MEEDIDRLIKKLTTIQNNFKKSPNRRYLEQTLISKAEESKDIYIKIIELLELTDEGTRKFLTRAARNTYAEIKIFIDTRLDIGLHLIKFKHIAQVVLAIIKIKNLTYRSKMATNMEIVKLVATLLPQFDGTEGKLDSTVSALRALDTLINDNNRAIAIQVILSRLEGKARSAINANPRTVNEIITSLQEKCKKVQSPEAVIAKLNATRQNTTVVDFAEKIEKLSLELEKTYLAEDVPLESASRLASRAAIKALANGIKNSQTQLILKAGQFENLTSAITKATELEADQSQQKQIFWANHNQPRYSNSNYQSRFTTSSYRGRGSNYRGRIYSNSRFQHTNRNGPQQRYETNRFQDQNNDRYQSNTQHNRPQYRGRGRGNVYVAQQQQPQQQQQQQPQQNQPQQQSNSPNNTFLGVPFGQQHTQ